MMVSKFGISLFEGLVFRFFSSGGVPGVSRSPVFLGEAPLRRDGDISFP